MPLLKHGEDALCVKEAAGGGGGELDRPQSEHGAFSFHVSFTQRFGQKKKHSIIILKKMVYYGVESKFAYIFMPKSRLSNIFLLWRFSGSLSRGI